MEERGGKNKHLGGEKMKQGRTWMELEGFFERKKNAM